MWKAGALVFTIVLGGPTVGRAQAFDAASIKESSEATAAGGMRLLPSGDIAVQRMPLRTLIAIAHEVDAYRVVAGPGWAGRTFYDIEARTNAADVARQATFAMMRSMLADRFKLAAHWETRQVSGFALVRLKMGTLGDGLRPSPVNCEKTTVARCDEGDTTPNSASVNGLPWAGVVRLLADLLHAPLLDRTGLSGAFDLSLEWSTGSRLAPNIRELRTALQQQLGLRLERRQVPTEVLVIDRVERPSPD